MQLQHLLILAIVQGITEFLPVSSSGHLVLTWQIFDWAGWALPMQAASDRLTLDIAVHVGTLGAVCLYYWRDLLTMAGGVLRLANWRKHAGARLVLQIALGTLPLAVVGFLARDWIALYLHDLEVTAWATVLFAVVLYVADRATMTLRRLEHMTFGQAILVGLAQVLALIPGTSRSGITMTAARFLGFERADAARFSLLLSIPAILGPGLLAGLELEHSGNAQLGVDALIAASLSFLVALLAIAAMIAWLRRASFTVFVVYRLALGGFLLALIYGGALAG